MHESQDQSYLGTGGDWGCPSSIHLVSGAILLNCHFGDCSTLHGPSLPSWVEGWEKPIFSTSSRPSIPSRVSRPSSVSRTAKGILQGSEKGH